MQVNVEKISPVLVELSVEIGADRVKTEVEKAFRAVAKTARVKGFRPGKAPRQVLDHVYGARVAADVAQRLIDETYQQAVQEHKVQPVADPALETPRLERGKAYNYKARVEVLPEIEDVKYEGLEAKRPAVQVTDEEVKAELEELRRANSTLETPKEPRPAQAGDVVTIDFEVAVEGEVVPGAGAKDFQIELGSGQLIEAIDQALLGKNVGDKAEASVDMPAAHPHPALQGKTCVFQIELKGLKERVLPAADDEFAKDLGDFDTLEALEADLKSQIEARKKEESDNTLAERLVAELVKANPVEVPPTLVQRQMRITEQEILQRARSQGGQVGGLGEELRQRVLEDSEMKVRAGLLMAAIAKKENIQIGNEQIEEGLTELSKQTGKNVAKLRAEYAGPRRREMLVGMILENKVLDIIEAKANITEE
ncbi:MAG: trigger factor [Myxococcales bacterium]|nr:trigger factor [Myxococcales bacterium]